MALSKRLIKKISEVRFSREKSKELTEIEKATQKEILPMMQEADPNKIGIIYNPDDESNGAAFWQQSSGSEVWKTEQIIEWLREIENMKLWAACSSRVFDVKKWEAQVGARAITPKQAKKFLTTKQPPSPFIRFGKPTKDSLR